MATVIRLQRGGRKKRPFYSIVVMDKRSRRDGAFIEKLGYFDPCKQPEEIKIDRARVEHWLSQGAQASARVMRLLAATAEADRPGAPAPEAAASDLEAGDGKADA